jgi:hypothetical protein
MNRKPSAKTAQATRDKVATFARVQRPSLLEFLLDGFYTLPKLPQAIIDSPVIRAHEHADAGYTVQVDSLGRKGADVLATDKAARSAAESIRLWVSKNVPTIDSEKVAVVVEGDTEPTIRVYRKA